MRHRRNDTANLMTIANLGNASFLSIEQAINAAVAHRSGHVIGAKLKQKGTKVFWRVKILTEEGPIKLSVDGRSGAILAPEGHNDHTRADHSMPAADTTP